MSYNMITKKISMPYEAKLYKELLTLSLGHSSRRILDRRAVETTGYVIIKVKISIRFCT